MSFRVTIRVEGVVPSRVTEGLLKGCDQGHLGGTVSVTLGGTISYYQGHLKVRPGLLKGLQGIPYGTLQGIP